MRPHAAWVVGFQLYQAAMEARPFA